MGDAVGRESVTCTEGLPCGATARVDLDLVGQQEPASDVISRHPKCFWLQISMKQESTHSIATGGK